MSFKNKIIGRVAETVTNLGFYLGALSSPRRMYIPRYVGDWHYDTSTLDIDLLVGASRWLANNNAYYSQILNVIQLYTVGARGLQILPNSSDPKFNEIARKGWEDFCQDCDIAGNLPFEHSQSVCAQGMARDGNVFCYLCYERGEPKIQWLEYQRVRGFGSISERDTTCAGIITNKYGKPTAYNIRTRLDGGEGQRIPADKIVHFYDPTRFGQQYGVPVCTPVINDFIDLIMLQDFVMDREKYLSSRIGFFEVPGGEKMDFGRLRASTLGNGTVQKPSPFPELSEDEKAAIRKSIGAHVSYIPQGYKFTDVRSDTPGENTLNYFDMLLTKILCGCSVSRQFVCPVSTQGTVARIDVEINNENMISLWSILAAGFKRIYKHAISKYSYLTKVDDWDACVVQPPRSVSADLKYEMDILTEGLKYGVFTLEEVLARRGKNPEEHYFKLAQEYKRAQQAAKEAGTTIPELFSRGLASLSGNMPAQNTQETKDKEPNNDQSSN